MCRLRMVFLGLLVGKEQLFLKSQKATQTFTKGISCCALTQRASRVSGLTVFVSLVMCVCV